MYPFNVGLAVLVNTQLAKAFGIMFESDERHSPIGHADDLLTHAQVFCRAENEAPRFTAGDADSGGAGVYIQNYDPNTHESMNGTMYFLYESNSDTVPYKYTVLPPMGSVFVAVCPTFEGRVVRGDSSYLDGQPHLLGTWAEVNWHPGDVTWGDISVLEGNDGAAIITSLDPAQNTRGFAVDLITNAPPDARVQKASGAYCLDKIVGTNANQVAQQWESQHLDPAKVYLTNDINPVINSDNGRWQITFYEGSI